uniref:ORF1 n=1 Tax=Manihot esculenta associated ampelovirus 1 TaxID=2843331 RepID=A0A8F0FRJ8_9CLOS|nr:ORF1 [Manihot esculenta associated ampelovirus 1]
MSSLPHLRSKAYPKATPEQKARRNPPPPIQKYYTSKELTALHRYQQNHPFYIPTVRPSNRGYVLPEGDPRPTTTYFANLRKNAAARSQTTQQRSPPTTFRKSSGFPHRYHQQTRWSASPQTSPSASSRSSASAKFNPPPTITLKMLAEARKKATSLSQAKQSSPSSVSSPGSRYSVLSGLPSDGSPPSLKTSSGGSKRMVQIYVPKSTGTSTSPVSDASVWKPVQKSKYTAAQKGKSKVQAAKTPYVVSRAKEYAANRTPPSMPAALKIYDGRKNVGVFQCQRDRARVEYERKYGSTSSTSSERNVAPKSGEAPPRRSGVVKQHTMKSLTDSYVMAENRKFRQTTANMSKAEAVAFSHRMSEPSFYDPDEDKAETLTSHFQKLLTNMQGPVRVHVAGRNGERIFCKVADEIGYKVGPVSVSRVLAYVYGRSPTPSDISFIISKKGWAHVFQGAYYVGYAPLSMPKWVMLRLAGEQRVYPTIVGNSGCYQIRNKDRWPTLQEYIMADLFHGYSKLDDVWVYDPVSKRANRGNFGFCWLPLYLRSGCSVVEIPSCPFVKKGVLEKRFGRQKYVWNGNLLHLAPAYGSYVDGESNRLVGAAEIEEISDSLPNLTADSSLGDMVTNVLKRTMLNNNSRFALTLDEVMNSALTASLTHKKHTRLRVPQVLTSEEKQLLEKVWGHNNFEWGTNTPSPHAFLNAMRAIFNQEYSRNYRHLRVSDVGGNCVTHVLNGDLNVHVCNPICDAKDFNRHLSTIPTLLNEALIKRNNSADFERFMLALRAMSTCRKTISTCAVPCTVITMVDVYDISLTELVRGMEMKGSVCARLCFMYPPELISTSGFVAYPHTNLTVERCGDQVVWCVGQCGDAYIHNVHNVLSYLTTGRYVSTSGLLYHVELVAQRGPYMDFCVSLTQPTTPLRNTVRKYVTWRGEFSVVRVVVNNPTPHVRTMYLERDFCRRTVMYLGNVCSSFEDRTFEYAVSALRSNMTMMVVGAKIVHKKVEISNDVVFEVASSLLREAVNRRTTAVRFHKTGLNLPSKLFAWISKWWTKIVQFVKNLFSWVTEPVDVELAKLLSGEIPYVEDVPDSIEVNLSDATSDVRLVVQGLDEVFDLAAQVAWKAQLQTTSANIDARQAKEAGGAEDEFHKTSKNSKSKTVDKTVDFDLDVEVPNAGLLGGAGDNWYDFLLHKQKANADGDCMRAQLWRLMRKITRLLKNWKKIPVLGWVCHILSFLGAALKWVYEKTLKPDLPEEETTEPKTVSDKLQTWFKNVFTSGVNCVQSALSNMAAHLSKKIIQVVEIAAAHLRQRVDETINSMVTTLQHNVASFQEAMNMRFNKKAIVPKIKQSKWTQLSTLLLKSLQRFGPYVACSTAAFSLGWYIYHNESCRNSLLAGWQYLKAQTVHKYYVDKVKSTFMLLGLMVDVPCFSLATLACPENWMYFLSVGSLGRRVVSGSLTYCKILESVLLLRRVSELAELLIPIQKETTKDVSIEINAAEVFREEQLMILQGEYLARMKKALLPPTNEEKITNPNQIVITPDPVESVEDKILPVERALTRPAVEQKKLMADAMKGSFDASSKGKQLLIKAVKHRNNDIEASSSKPPIVENEVNTAETTVLLEPSKSKDEIPHVENTESDVRPPPPVTILTDINTEGRKHEIGVDTTLGEMSYEEEDETITTFLNEYCGKDGLQESSDVVVNVASDAVPSETHSVGAAISEWEAEMAPLHALVARSAMDDETSSSDASVARGAITEVSQTADSAATVSTLRAAPYIQHRTPSSVSVVSLPPKTDIKVFRSSRPLPWEKFLSVVGIKVDIYNEFLENIPEPRSIPTIVKNQDHVDILEFTLYVTHECSTIMTLLKKAVHGSLIWDPRRKTLTCPMLHEKDCKPLRMFEEFKPFSYISEGLHFYPTVVGDHDTKKIAFAEEIYETKGPYFCVGDTSITHSMVKLRGILLALRRYDQNIFEDKQISYINAVPGAGKTYSIIARAKVTTERMLILTANRASSDELKVELDDQRKKGLVSVATLDSALMHLDKIATNEYEEMWVDECYMVHVGHINLLLGVLRAKRVVMLGDRRQIPFINRLKGVAICHSFMNINLEKLEEKCITYRCPADICWWLSNCKFGKEQAYGQPVRTAAKLRILKSVRAHPIQSVTPDMVENKEKIIVFTQWEKEKLSADFVNGGRPELKRKISTVHECQGKTFSTVALVRVKPAMDEVFNSMPHRLVALTRHTTSLDFYCIRNRIDQGIGKDVELIEKLTEYVAKTFVIQQCS